jgi:two-component system cell cycle response regulator CtrA
MMQVADRSPVAVSPPVAIMAAGGNDAAFCQTVWKPGRRRVQCLLIEDEAETARYIATGLRELGIGVTLVGDAAEGLAQAAAGSFDVIILDRLLPGAMDGLTLLQHLRQAEVATPVLILSALASLDERVRGLQVGADDYLTKPFDRAELVARIQAIVRRSKGHSESIIRTGRLSVNLDKRVVEVDDEPLHLTGKEYGILELLSLRKGQTLTKEQFLNHLYGGIDEPELKIIDVFICKLRKKLAGAIGATSYIDTVWGRGYVLRDPEERAAATPAVPGRSSQLA